RLEELKRAEEQQWALEHGDAPHESAARETSSLAVAPPQDPPSTPLDTPATTPSAATPVAPAIHSLDEPGLVQPVLRSQPAIRYPRMARLGRIEGEVFVSCIVDESGRVISARVVKGHAMLREEALRQILKRRYSPPTKNGAGVRVRFTTRVVFRLSD
ncbi:MAG: TonB family protein, partial [Vicinamibacteria bacterium]|nr:TonB family protein [Vicinamibacteria bacterium]